MTISSLQLHNGQGIVRGNVLSIRRNIVGVPNAITLSSAKLTGKTNISDPDGSALFQVSATIEANGSTGVATARFDLTAVNTNAPAANTQFYYDIKFTFSDGTILTLESGTTFFSPAIGTT